MLEVTKYSDTLIEGNVDVKKNNLMFTSIAYDEGWKVLVDGKEVKTKKLANAYLGFNIKKGNHHIKMVYYPKYMKQGLIISMISLFTLIGYIIYKNKTIKKDKFIV